MVKVSDKKKSERVKQYFAEITRQIILEEGEEAVSIRKVAEKAGYSFATIYNHFDNLDEMLWYARNLLIKDVADHLDVSVNGPIESVADLKKLFHAYAKYYLDHPAVFRFFYFRSLDKSQKKSPSLVETEEYRGQFSQGFEFLIRAGYCSPEKVGSVGKALIYVIQGILSLQFAENDAIRSDDVFREIDTSMDILLEGLIKP
jgi:AcrR family transcriptional regulator